MAIEAIFYFIGFLSCLLLLTIIVEVNERDKKMKKRRRRHLTSLAEPNIERNQEEINIDVVIH